MFFAGGHSGHADHEAAGADPSSEDHADDTPLNTTCNMEPARTIDTLYFSVFILQYFQQEFLFFQGYMFQFLSIYIYIQYISYAF